MLYISSGQILYHYIWQLFLCYVIISVILGESVVLPMNWQSGIWGIKTEEGMCVYVCVCMKDREKLCVFWEQGAYAYFNFQSCCCSVAQ